VTGGGRIRGVAVEASLVPLLADLLVGLIALVALLVRPQSESDGTLALVAVIALLYFAVRVATSAGRLRGRR
jgi:hypothetical protein